MSRMRKQVHRQQIESLTRRAIEPDPKAPSTEEPTSLPLALGRIHQRLPKQTPLSASLHDNRPISIQNSCASFAKVNLRPIFDKIRIECEVCQAATQAPARNKTSGLRAETFGDMTFIGHCQVPLVTGKHISFSQPEGSNNIAHCKGSDDHARIRQHHCPQELL